jgi:hypothetical protein
MKTTWIRQVRQGGALLLLAGSTALGLAAPLKVQPVDGDAQTVVMCPHCDAPIACAKAGDLAVAFTADLLDPAALQRVRLSARVSDPATGAPVGVAKVVLALSMSKQGHWHEITPPLTLDRQSSGVYSIETGRLMKGAWRVEVRATTVKGDTVTQKFAFEL